MISNGQILAEVKALKSSIDSFKRVIDIQSVLIHELRKDNRDLLNRFMVQGNMREYAATSPASIAEIDVPAQELARGDMFAKEVLEPGEIANET